MDLPVINPAGTPMCSIPSNTDLTEQSILLTATCSILNFLDEAL